MVVSRLSALSDAVIDVAKGEDLRESLRRLIENAVIISEATYGALGTISSDGALETFTYVGLSEESADEIERFPEGKGLLGHLLKHPTPLRLASIKSSAASVGFPDGHPASDGDSSHDIEVLIEKERRGATFATTQFFFEVDKWKSLVDKLEAKGSALPIIPGILPVTNVKQLNRMAELSGTPIPKSVSEAFAQVEDNLEDVRKLGVDIATKLCQELLEAGAPGLHFYTMNTSTATREIYSQIKDLR